MKKIKTIQKKHFSKKGKKWLGFVCILGVVLTGIIFLIDSLQEKERVSAHPTNEITLGSVASNNDFKLPVDAVRLKEAALPAGTTGFQGEDIVPIIEKGDISGRGVTEINSAIVNGEIRSIERTNYGHMFVLYGISGTNRGGMVKVAVFNSNGQELATMIHGTMTNVNLRVNTLIYSASNNSFLVGVHNGSFFRYEVSGESANSATITRTNVDVLNNPLTAMKCDTNFVVDTFSDYSNSVLIAGRLDVSKPNLSGLVPGRTPFGELEISGWENSTTPSISGNVVNTFSVESLRNQDMGLGTNGSPMFLSPVLLYQHPDNRNLIFGTFFNEINLSGTVTQKRSFQLFDKSEEITENGQAIKKRKYEHFDANNYSVVKGLCEGNNVFFMAYYSDRTELIRVDLTTFTGSTVKTYPRSTYLNIVDNNDGTVSYYGSTTSLTGEFASNYYSNAPGVSYYFISGIMGDYSQGLGMVSLRAFSVSGIVNATHILTLPTANKLFVGGTTRDTSSTFVNDLEVYDADGNDQRGAGASSSGNTAFTGILEIKDDYSPVINAGTESIIVDINDEAIRNPSPTNYRGWSTLDRWLITGVKNGTVDISTAIKVYDHFDSNDPQIGLTPQLREEWLQKRINRNPRSSTQEIEWGKLGFSNREVGPQLVTYFVTDSQSQPAVTSRWVNAKGPQTVTDEDNKYALNAENFHIPLSGINTAIQNDNKFKELAKTLAWNMTNNKSNSGEYGNGIDEDGTSKDSSSVQNKLSSKVTVNQTHLTTLKNATVAKPYPVDVTYQPDSGPAIINRVWVFVTTDNTVPNTETAITPEETNGVVIYADDYTIPYRLRLNQDLDTVLTDGKVKAYNYYAKDRTDDLAPLPDSTGNQSNWSITNLNVIHDPFSGGAVVLPTTVQPVLNYHWRGATDYYHIQGEETEVSLDVTLTGDVLLHLRQVIQGTNDQLKELVVPTEGYLSIQNIVNSGGSSTVDPDYQAHVTIPSGKQADVPSFTEVAVNIEQLANRTDQVNLTPIIPEFYKYNGYYLSNEEASQNNNSLNAPNNVALSQIYMYARGELWITIYLEPNGTNEGNPQPYSWDYKRNEFGKITE